MSSPIRFFCSRCNLMMKIGASMLGKSVVCPDCEMRIEVPFLSDPRAESLCRRMTQLGLPPTPSESSAQPAPLAQKSPPNPQSRSGVSSLSPLSAELSRPEVERLDDWIERLWMDVPDSGVVSESRHDPVTLSNTNSEPVDEGKKVPLTIGRLGAAPAIPQPMAMFLAFVFLIGVVSGFLLRPLIVSDRNTVGAENTKQMATVIGKLTFETPDEKPMPDADAVVIFLPIARIPIVPFSGRTLRPHDGTEATVSEPSEAIQQIEELGGHYFRADAEGKFSFSVDTAGWYLGILISSHAVRSEEAKWNAETDRNLRRYFREPADLLGNYRFRCDEYELKQGEILSVQCNFSR